MSRLCILAAAISLAGALVTACASGGHKTSVPAGLVFDCGADGPLTIRFNGGGYLPDSNAVGRARDGTAVQRPRSTARLHFRDGEHAMVAEWAELGLRYRSVEPGADGRHLIWSLQGEEATLGRRVAVPGPGGDPAGDPVAVCRRDRIVPQAGRRPDHAIETPHHQP